MFFPWILLMLLAQISRKGKVRPGKLGALILNPLIQTDSEVLYNLLLADRSPSVSSNMHNQVISYTTYTARQFIWLLQLTQIIAFISKVVAQTGNLEEKY